MAVLVSHPHVAAVSAGLAACLEADGKLAAYFTGVALAGDHWSGKLAAEVAARRPVVGNRIVAGIPARRLRAHSAIEIGARATARLAHLLGSGINLYNTLFVAHDRAVSWARWPRETTAIYAYEDAALWTFQRAARRELARVWDLPTPHHSVAEAIFRDETARWPDAASGPAHREPPWKKVRKDRELELATRVSVASAFTKDSLVGQSPRVPVVVTPYGFPVDEFKPAPRPGGKFRVLSVGAHNLRKGTPYLLEAWKRAAIPDAELHLVGTLDLAKTFVDRYAGLFHHWAHVPRAQLAARYTAADLLVFPTLGDGFGLVIQEAMCSGTPVITTPCGGGPECITDGLDGWLIPPRDIDALVDRLRSCARDRDRVHAVGRAARARAERWTWRDAGRALVRALEL